MERDRRAVLELTIDGRIGNTTISDTRTSQPIELRQANSSVDMGYADFVVQRLPTTFNSLRLRVAIAKTSKDGLQDLLTTMGEISATTPSLTPAQAALGYVSAAKTIADFLFNKRLIERTLNSLEPFPGSGSSLRSGVYAILGGDRVEDYTAYQGVAPNGRRLSWDGQRLIWNGRPLERLSYFVIEVTYDSRIHSKPEDALNFAGQKPWADLYQVALRKADEVNSLQEADRVTAEVRAHLSNARTLLDADVDYVQAERDAIHEAIRTKTQRRLTDSLATLRPAQDTVTAKQPVVSTDLAVPKDLAAREILRDVERSAENPQSAPSTRP